MSDCLSEVEGSIPSRGESRFPPLFRSNPYNQGYSPSPLSPAKKGALLDSLGAFLWRVEELFPGSHPQDLILLIQEFHKGDLDSGAAAMQKTDWMVSNSMSRPGYKTMLFMRDLVEAVATGRVILPILFFRDQESLPTNSLLEFALSLREKERERELHYGDLPVPTNGDEND